MRRESMTTRIAITPGEPAGIGPELAVMLAQRPRDARLVAVCDPSLLEARAAALALPLELLPDDGGATPDAGCTNISAVAIGKSCTPAGTECPAGYSCESLAGAVLTFGCQILCDDDCDCPTGTMCQPFTDKSGVPRFFCLFP